MDERNAAVATAPTPPGACTAVIDAGRPMRHDRHRRPSPWRLLLLSLCVTSAGFLAACERTEAVQRGNRGTSMMQLYKPTAVEVLADINAIPEPEPVDPPEPDGPTIAETFKNVRVLTDLSVLEFSRVMQAMSTWVAPEEGCEFCHNPNNLASDEKYTKVVARRMLTMTRQINTQWKDHVKTTGVTCWTCHRGQAVPSGDWFARPGETVNTAAGGIMGYKAAQNAGGIKTVGNSSLPYDPLSTYLTQKNNIRVQSGSALPTGNAASIKNAETTYALMMYMASSLGVNCTYCHSTRAMASWQESTPQRATAWYGIRLVRELNNDYLIPLKPLFPAHRLSAEGDGPKVGCETCHKGAYKPMYGVSMLQDYPELAGPVTHNPDGSIVLPPAAASAPVSRVPLQVTMR